MSITAEFTEGVCEDGAAILKNGIPMSIDQILVSLRELETAKMTMYCEALGMIRQARALLRDEAKTANSRELEMAITGLDEAVLWREEDLRKKAPSVDEDDDDDVSRDG